MLCAVVFTMGISTDASAMGILLTDANIQSDVCGEISFMPGSATVANPEREVTVYFEYDDSEELGRCQGQVRIPAGQVTAYFSYGVNPYSICTNWKVTYVFSGRTGQWRIYTSWEQPYYVPGL